MCKPHVCADSSDDENGAEWRGGRRVQVVPIPKRRWNLHCVQRGACRFHLGFGLAVLDRPARRMLYSPLVGRGGRAVDGGCLENSRAKAPGVRIPPSPSRCPALGRCQSGRMGPPAKWVRSNPSRVRIPPSPPRIASRAGARLVAFLPPAAPTWPYCGEVRHAVRLRGHGRCAIICFALWGAARL